MVAKAIFEIFVISFRLNKIIEKSDEFFHSLDPHAFKYKSIKYLEIDLKKKINENLFNCIISVKQQNHYYILYRVECSAASAKMIVKNSIVKVKIDTNSKLFQATISIQ